jgi:hypothetical protein
MQAEGNHRWQAEGEAEGAGSNVMEWRCAWVEVVAAMAGLETDACGLSAWAYSKSGTVGSPGHHGLGWHRRHLSGFMQHLGPQAMAQWWSSWMRLPTLHGDEAVVSGVAGSHGRRSMAQQGRGGRARWESSEVAKACLLVEALLWWIGARKGGWIRVTAHGAVTERWARSALWAVRSGTQQRWVVLSLLEADECADVEGNLVSGLGQIRRRAGLSQRVGPI